MHPLVSLRVRRAVMASLVLPPLLLLLAVQALSTTTADTAPAPLAVNTPLYVNVGGPSYGDTQGRTWQADQAYATGAWGYWHQTGSQAYAASVPMMDTPDPALYTDNRFWLGDSGQTVGGYSFDVTNRQYLVTLKFAEIYYWGVGQRSFDVLIEGQSVLSNLDIFLEVNRYRAFDASFLVNITDGQLNVDVVSRVQTPNIAAIAVEPWAGGPTLTPTITKTRTATPTPDGGWTVIATQDFENPIVAPWRTEDDNGATGGEYTFGNRTCRVFAGNYAGWAVGGGASGSARACGTPYPTNSVSWLTYGPFSLVGANAAQLNFKQWLNTEQSFDVLCRLASIDGTNFSGWCASGTSTGWVDYTLDLANIPEQGSYLGQANVWVALVFDSDSSIVLPEGAYVDDIVLRKQMATTATRTPTSSRTPTRTQTPTRTITSLSFVQVEAQAL